MTDTIRERFEDKYIPEPMSGCWIWIGSTSSVGYGNFFHSHGRRCNVAAHRMSWEIHNDKPPSWLCVCHKCDNRSCVNPDHLFLGTKKDNTQDMIAKGRHKPADAKLTVYQVEEIRRLIGVITGAELAKRFGVSFGHISKIKLGTRRSFR